MNNLRKKIQMLENNMDARRKLRAYKYGQVKLQVRNKLTSPAAFLSVFLIGFLIAARKKIGNRPVQTEATFTKLLDGLSKTSSVLMLTQYIKNAYTKSIAERNSDV